MLLNWHKNQEKIRWMKAATCREHGIGHNLSIVQNVDVGVLLGLVEKHICSMYILQYKYRIVNWSTKIFSYFGNSR